MDFKSAKTRVHTTTSCESQAAAITLRLIEDEGLNAAIFDVADMTIDGFPIRSQHRYAVLVLSEEAS